MRQVSFARIATIPLISIGEGGSRLLKDIPGVSMSFFRGQGHTRDTSTHVYNTEA